MQTFQDILAIFWLFVLRIGVPLAITLAVGYWLEKKLRAPVTEPTHEIKPVLEQAAHCWEIKGCPPEAFQKCPAFLRQDLPCWLANQVATGVVKTGCSTCGLFKTQPTAPQPIHV